MKIHYFLAVAFLGILSASVAQAPSAKQRELDGIIARAQDAKQPQAPSITDQQLKEWVAKFGGSIKRVEVDDPDSAGGQPPILRARARCQTTTKHGYTCRLVKAEQSGSGKMSCTYVCS